MHPLTPKISIIIPAYNEENYLSRCLDSLLLQDYRDPYEILVIDNASTDRTGEIARAYPNVKVLYQPEKSLVKTIMFGCSQARGRIYVFTDADTDHPANWLGKIVQKMAVKGIVACGGPCYFYDGPTWVQAFNRYLVKFQHMFGQRLPLGANMAVRKNAFWQAGGYAQDTELQSDRALSLRLRKIGTVLFSDELAISMSARRFKSAPKAATESLTRLVNVISLALVGSTVFKMFDDVRK
jgi:glycosyltransferase involved in cell wall biosynthesis